MIHYHKPVMLKEAISYLALKDNGIYVDATLGGGGHSSAILQANKTVRLYSFDRDEEAIRHNHNLKESNRERFLIFNDNFVNIRSRLALERITKIDGILFDLGVSFSQISTPSRGMSFDLDGRLDMRMNQQDELTAHDVVNTYSLEELTKIFREYGEEREAYRIALGIIKQRQIRPIETTLDLSEIIDKSTHSAYKIKAKARIFQGIRIYINGELEALKAALYDAVELINPTGRIVVISYHSLEDRTVKQLFVQEEKECICPPKFPKCICNKKKKLKIITKRPLLPSPEEVAENRQARSAKMRVAERINSY
ncbi:MAG: 16S rRNA (cytosine(1402)-N(4))-methyltransferase RsmH [Candidatus Cloacimonetes bacterium]|nr:16S rRNA (cytosine(1402)-N(4))-methyltransferase RsmH [Candidatus Cloacimonadota bacterium]